MSDPTDRKIPASRLALLSLTALGVVYGDIGTSPLYAIRECFYGAHGVPVSHDNVLGVLSLIVWTLVILVTIKYHVYIIRADNKGEGGILALMALARSCAISARVQKFVLALGLFGAALLYGDGMLTPAISVLSAVEGLEVATPFFTPYVIPITVGILTVLFLFQSRGTTKVGIVFGPIIMAWFAFLAVLGLVSIVKEPSVLAAFHPKYAMYFLLQNGLTGYLVMGAVFLVATGGEALYADLGHFSERSIQIDWFFIAGPALLLNYFGQGALLLRDAEAAHNPFYMLVPQWALYPTVALATMATVIASQAVISGVFSLTRQAVQLGFAPRARIIHTSSQEIGQIYIPSVNWVLLLATVALVIGFRRSTNLAAAYGVAVSVTMLITTLLAYIVSRHLWGWKLPAALGVSGAFLIADTAFFGANAVKIFQGGWFPLLVAAAVTMLFMTWRKGQDLLAMLQKETSLPLTQFVREAKEGGIARVPGTAIFLSGSTDITPSALLHNLKHNRILHQQNFFVTVQTEEVPRLLEGDRFKVESLSRDFHKVIIRYGFMEDPNIPAVLAAVQERGFDLNPHTATYILSDNTLVTSKHGRMASWRLHVFSFLYRNALKPTQFFRLPYNQVVEIGRQIQL